MSDVVGRVKPPEAWKRSSVPFLAHGASKGFAYHGVIKSKAGSHQASQYIRSGRHQPGLLGLQDDSQGPLHRHSEASGTSTRGAIVKDDSPRGMCKGIG